MTAFAALLRGINVGGKNMVPMKALVPMFEAAGCASVRSYIQSGNVVFEAKAALAGKVPTVVGAALRARFGFSVPIVVRSASALARIAAENPFLAEGASPDAFHVAFLTTAPAAAHVALLDPHRSPPDRFHVRGTEIYLHCPNGVGKSKLTNAWFDTKLETVSTARNWRTLLTLVDMTRA